MYYFWSTKRYFSEEKDTITEEFVHTSSEHVAWDKAHDNLRGHYAEMHCMPDGSSIFKNSRNKVVGFLKKVPPEFENALDKFREMARLEREKAL